MWSCKKNCGYWEERAAGCSLDYNAETLFRLCPCYSIAVTHARAEPAREDGKQRRQIPGSTNGANNRSQGLGSTSCAKQCG